MTKRKRPSSTTSRRSQPSKPPCARLVTRRIASVTRARSSTAWPKATAGIWSSTSPKECTASAARPWCPRCWTPMKFRTRFPIRSPFDHAAQGYGKARRPRSGYPTPDFEIVEGPSDLERVALPFPLFIKPIAEGTSKGNCRSVEGPRPVRTAIRVRAAAGAPPPAGACREFLPGPRIHRRDTRHGRRLPMRSA